MKQSNLNPSDYSTYFKKAISYQAYLENFQTELRSGDASPFAEYLPQNWSRQSRLDRKLKLQEELLAAIQDLKLSINWLVITEHWCGDASQINPIINKVALESNGKINLKFIYRDEHLDLIDAHLTDGRSRSIPILLQMDKDFNLLKTYGPRPAEAQVLVMDLIAKKEPYNLPLHTWYAKDKQRIIQEDLKRILSYEK